MNNHKQPHYTVSGIEAFRKHCEKMAEAVAAMSDEEIGPLTPEEEEARQRIIQKTDALVLQLSSHQAPSRVGPAPFRSGWVAVVAIVILGVVSQRLAQWLIPNAAPVGFFAGYRSIGYWLAFGPTYLVFSAIVDMCETVFRLFSPETQHFERCRVSAVNMTSAAIQMSMMRTAMTEEAIRKVFQRNGYAKKAIDELLLKSASE